MLYGQVDCRRGNGAVADLSVIGNHHPSVQVAWWLVSNRWPPVNDTNTAPWVDVSDCICDWV